MTPRTTYRVETFRTARGDDPILDFLQELNSTGRRDAVTKVISAVDMLRDQGFHLHDDVLRKVRGEVWELRVTVRRNPYRVLLYHFGDGLFVLLHATHKKDNAIPESDILKAERRMADDREMRGRQ